MVSIFHGDNQVNSRQSLDQYLHSLSDVEIFKITKTNIDLDQINNFLHGQTFFSGEKILVVENFFSLNPAIQKKLVSLVQKDDQVCLWQDKTLSLAQLKLFSSAKVLLFKAENLHYLCLDTIKPHNFKNFMAAFRSIDPDELGLFIYLLKNKLRRQLQTFSRFSPRALGQTYLRLIELDFQIKTGTILQPKEIQLETILLDLIE